MSKNKNAGLSEIIIIISLAIVAVFVVVLGMQYWESYRSFNIGFPGYL